MERKEKMENQEKIGKKTFYYYEGLVNDYGSDYGQVRHVVWGIDREEAVKELSKYIAGQLKDGKTVLGCNWAIDVRGKTPDEAAEIRLTDDNGGSDEKPWGQDTDVWSQESFGEDIGSPITRDQLEKLKKHFEGKEGK